MNWLATKRLYSLVFASSVCLREAQSRGLSGHIPYVPSFMISKESIQGKRSYMEDEIYISENKRFIAVYDG